MLTKSESQKKVIDAANLYGSFVMTALVERLPVEERAGVVEEMNRLHSALLVNVENYVSDQFERGHDRGYEDAENDYVAGRWDD